MFSEKEVAKYLNSNNSLKKHQGEFPKLNSEVQASPIGPTIDLDFQLVSMPSPELTGKMLPPFAELSELALFDRQELVYFNETEISTELMSGFWPSLDRSSRIFDIQPPKNLPAITQSDSSTTYNSLDPRLDPQRVSIAPTGLVDVFLLLCARSVGSLISTLTEKNSHKIAPAMLKGKLLLNLDEARIISGLSRTTIMNAIKNHELPFQLIGKTYLVKSKDLEQFVDNL
jgi:excisionase family DNA binding protein